MLVIEQFMADNVEYIVPLVISGLALAVGYFSMYKPMQTELEHLWQAYDQAVAPTSDGGSTITATESDSIWQELEDVWDELKKFRKPPAVTAT